MCELWLAVATGSHKAVLCQARLVGPDGRLRRQKRDTVGAVRGIFSIEKILFGVRQESCLCRRGIQSGRTEGLPLVIIVVELIGVWRQA